MVLWLWLLFRADSCYGYWLGLGLLGVTEQRLIDVLLFSNFTSAVRLLVSTGFKVKFHRSDENSVLVGTALVKRLSCDC